MTTRLRIMGGLLTAVSICACSSASQVTVPTHLAALTTCEDAFRAWVQNAQSLNEPDSDLVSVAASGEGIQRRVFELCSLADAERFNQEMQLTNPMGSEPMIQPDFRTFAEVECVDESPLLDGTPLCAEVGH